MFKRHVALSVALALLPLSACTVHVGTNSTTRRHTSTKKSSSFEKRLEFNGMALQVPYTWRGETDGSRMHVVTGGDCQKQGYPEADTCRGFWLFGAEDIARGDEGGPFTPAKPFYPQSDSVPCPNAPETFQTTPQAPTAERLAQVGTGHRGDYREWDITCISPAGGAKEGGFTQRTLHLPQSRILVVDNWETAGLVTRLEQATWS
ncbi:hypothetical protein [Actinomadura fibrosa]|uniref:Lipoprotein n=1 Tax=Actinomadura fibrosa TaxID=111802 RepID=A0ABW2XB23_9ACTN|nr:hypothetical protein [Actinomadura fibrosa]